MNHAQPSPALAIDLGSLPRGGLWSRRVEMEGTLECTVANHATLLFTLDVNGTPAVCFLASPIVQDDFLAKRGDRLRVVGVFDRNTRAAGGPFRGICQIMNLGDISILDDASDAEPESPNLIKSLNEVQALPHGRTIRGYGFVGFLNEGENFLLEDATGSLFVEYAGVEPIKEGDKNSK